MSIFVNIALGLLALGSLGTDGSAPPTHRPLKPGIVLLRPIGPNNRFCGQSRLRETATCPILQVVAWILARRALLWNRICYLALQRTGDGSRKEFEQCHN